MMDRSSQKVLVIAGPTAVGKTQFGIRCAEVLDGEIISGDSIQVYRGLDIGSAKADKSQLAAVPHHLIDILDPKEVYNVKMFQELSRGLIDEISSKGRLPIIVGGTGLYIKACLYDFRFPEEEGPDDPYDGLSNEEIYEQLKQKDPDALKKIHVNNRRRLVRALNVCQKRQGTFSGSIASQRHEPIYDCLIIGLTTEKDVLYQRIGQRIDEMMEDGLLEEIEGLLARGVSFSDRCMQGIGYKEFKPYFEGQRSLGECVDEVKRNSRRFAKRQYTYFKNQLDVHWHDDSEEAMKEIRRWSISAD